MAGTGLKIIVGLGVFALLSACGDKKPVEKDLPRVFVQIVKPADYAASVTLTGDVQARVQTELSFRVGGKIIQRMVDVGDRVSAPTPSGRLTLRLRSLRNRCSSTEDAEVMAKPCSTV